MSDTRSTAAQSATVRPLAGASPIHQPAWQVLQRLAAQAQPHLRDLLEQDPQRSVRMSAHAAGLTLDYTRQRLQPDTLQALLALLQQCEVPAQRDAMFAGQTINATERRAVLHVALRGSSAAAAPWGETISAQVREQLERVCAFAERVREGQLRGFDGAAITDVVNIGIGGSDLGPRMAAEALEHLAGEHVRVHYLSNPDAWNTYRLLRRLRPGSTVFIVASKTFTTQETQTIAASARRWLSDGGCPAHALARQLIGVTAAPAQALQQGYLPEQTFLFWDWVGGRYSVWSALGLPLAIAIGADAFRAFLNGAHAMDTHFRSAAPHQNLPMLAALVGIWNRNFLHAPTQLIAPYAARLASFPAFVQQMDMESNGKRTHIDGSTCEIDTGPIVWGGLGIDAQHAYFQLVHQGTHLVPVDFIGVRRPATPLPLAAEHDRVVNANLLAQARALSIGRDRAATEAGLLASGLAPAEAARLAPHRTFPGNVPSNLIWLEQLDAPTLGALIAFYEHKVFTQAAIWGTHAYDQWGVELGKQVVGEVYPLLQGGAAPASLDPATRASLTWLQAAGDAAKP
jgi:glucose-6-phosphate isomerase